MQCNCIIFFFMSPFLQICPTIFAKKPEGNDSNNNFQVQSIHHATSNFRIPKKLNDIVSSIHQKSKEVCQRDSTSNSLSFDSFGVSNLKASSDTLRQVISKKIENVFNANATKIASKCKEENQQITVGKNIQSQVKNNADKESISNTDKESMINTNKEVTEKDKTQKSPPVDVIRDSNSNHSTSNDGEIEKHYEESKTELCDSKEKPFKCEDCGKCFSQLRNYKYHR